MNQVRGIYLDQDLAHRLKSVDPKPDHGQVYPSIRYPKVHDVFVDVICGDAERVSLSLRGNCGDTVGTLFGISTSCKKVLVRQLPRSGIRGSAMVDNVHKVCARYGGMDSGFGKRHLE